MDIFRLFRMTAESLPVGPGVLGSSSSQTAAPAAACQGINLTRVLANAKRGGCLLEGDETGERGGEARVGDGEGGFELRRLPSKRGNPKIVDDSESSRYSTYVPTTPSILVFEITRKYIAEGTLKISRVLQ